MKNVVFSVVVLFVFIFVSCSSGDSKKNDDELQDNAAGTDEDKSNDEEIADKEITTDNETVDDEVDENETETDSDDDSTDELLADADDVNDNDVSQECAVPSEISEFSTKPYARMRAYMNPSEFPDDTTDDEYPDDDSYYDEVPEGIDYSFKAEYGSADWISDSYEMTAIVLPEFDEEDGVMKDYLFIEGTEKTENDSDIRWFIFMMDAAVLRDMKADGVNRLDFEEDAMIFIQRDVETETMSKTCLEAILKKGTVYACHDEVTNYGIYEPLNLWFALELETDEATILTETEYDELCQCGNSDGDPVDCETGDLL